MKIYTNESQTSQGMHTVRFRPLTFKNLFDKQKEAMNLERFTSVDGSPDCVTVTFINGEADVEDVIGKVMTHPDVRMASTKKEFNPIFIAPNIVGGVIAQAVI